MMDMVADQSLMEGAGLQGGAALFLRSVPHRGGGAGRRGGEAGENGNPQETGRALDQLPRGIGGATWRGGSCSVRVRRTGRQKRGLEPSENGQRFRLITEGKRRDLEERED